MIKSRFFLSAAALALLASSCSDENVLQTLPDDGTVSFNVTIADGVSSRAVIGDGLQAKNLKYAVYDAGTDALVSHGSASFGNALSTKVSLTLANGKDYKIAFFAYNNSNQYTFDAEAGTVTVNYDQMFTSSSISSSKDHDCFYKMEEISVTGPVSRTVTLTRPVAQINWGTNDLASDAAVNAYGTDIRSKFVGKAYSTLKLLTGEAENEVEVKISNTTKKIGASAGTFPVEGYDYLNHIYVLVPQGESSLIDCKLETYRGSSTLIHTVDVPNVPVQRNYRTNIYGALLTSQADITVEKDPTWNTPDNNVEAWRGEIKTPVEDADGNYGIGTAAELAGIAQMVNSGNTLRGKTVYLKNDIDLNNLNWTPIGNKPNDFKGHFDGKGFTVKNLTVKLAGKNSTYTGLFGYSWQGNSTFKNVTIDGATIDLRGQTGDACPASVFLGGGAVTEISGVTVKNATLNTFRQTGAISGNIYGNVKNCTVENTEITVEPELSSKGWDNGDKAGAILGITGEESYTISGNKASNVKVTAFRDLGGMFGMLHENNIYSGNTIDNSVVTVSLKNADKLGRSWENAGEIVGRTGSNVTDGGGNVATNVSLFTPSENVSTIEQLAAAVDKGGYITLAADANITVPGAVTISQPATIEIPAGATVTMTSTLNNKTELTINGEGSVISSDTPITNDGGKLTINGGSFKTTSPSENRPAVRIESGDVTINGGTYESVAGATVLCNFVNKRTGSLTINGGTFVNTASGMYALQMVGEGDFTINGGTYVGVFGCARVENGARAVINGGDFICNGSYYALAVHTEYNAGFAKPSICTVKGGNFWAKNKTLYCRAESTLSLEGGNYKSLESYSPAAGFTAVDADITRTFTVGDTEITCNYTKTIVK